ncbi:UDP-glucose 4-epimerase GalE [Methylocystis heyeri]|uniref:UDP-glucose 4-epimerase n=1 Tax=Methylocystis heyeri TaxID=391905 RepID=A0A6B8KI43_9HYPH|nr:UDP-glucose 4-epimerase GalE [Methylocystis heyeri]QGM47302.1 UDP-glucose 4-epimerase GalE [Methylocystis heyeri]
MSVLVTGGAGYIGSHMVLELLDAGEDVVVLDDLSTGFRWAVPPQVPLVIGDFGDENLVKDAIARYGVTEIVHFAAKIVVPESVARPLLYYSNNTAKARTLLETATSAGIERFIFSSTAAVYGDPVQNPVTEDEPPKPMSPYGRSKLMVEWMLEDVSKASNLKYVALRYFNVAGGDPAGRAGQSTPNATHLIKVAVQTALGLRPKMQLFGIDYPTHDGSCVRDYIQVTDLARAHMDALAHLRGGGQSLVCNAGYAKGFSVIDVIETVKRVSGRDFHVEVSERRPGDPAAIVAGNDLIKSALGWRPQHDDLEEIVRQALRWEQNLAERVSGNAGLDGIKTGAPGS